jgi:hypothetical protein
MNRGLKIAGCIVLGVLFVFVFGWITMTLWNWLIPSIFNGPAITYWQAFGLLVLSKILFSGFGGKGHHKGGNWKGRHYQKFANMSPEEREALKQKMRERWCNYNKNTPDQKPDASNA